MAVAPPPATEDAAGLQPGRLRHRTAYLLVTLLLLFIVVLLPFAVISMVDDFRHQQAPKHSVVALDGRPADRAQVAVDLIGMNEWEGTVTVRVTAYQECDGACRWRDRYRFVSIWGDDFQPSDRPTVQVVDVPESSRTVTTTFGLPISGDPLRYPFDRYLMALGVIMDRMYPDGRETTLTQNEADGYLTIYVTARIPRIVASAPDDLGVDNPQAQAPGLQRPYLFAGVIEFNRPLYLKVLTIFLVLLVTAAAAYAVFLRPLDQLIINAGALILGVWGIRVILLGTTLPGLTAVDLSLWTVILFLLVTITVRTLWLLEEGSGWRLLRQLTAKKRKAGPRSTDATAPAQAQAEPAATGAPRQTDR
jgi:hypothetical protein